MIIAKFIESGLQISVQGQNFAKAVDSATAKTRSAQTTKEIEL
jgi:hypothetical protein